VLDELPARLVIGTREHLDPTRTAAALHLTC
jgi:hypothetical protein